MKEIQKEYDTMDEIFNGESVIKHLKSNKIYMDRNRYIDILPFEKTRVILKNGVGLGSIPESDYINACFVNSPFKRVTDEETKFDGDAKIIAS